MAKTELNKTVLNTRTKWNDEARAGLLFVLPPVIGFLLFTAVPFFFSIYASFTSWDSMTDLTSLFSGIIVIPPKKFTKIYRMKKMNITFLF